MEFFREQLHALKSDLYPRAIKVGMLGTEELATEVGGWLQQLKEEQQETASSSSSSQPPPPPLVVVDPVMISTSGHKLIDDAAKSAMIQKVFPHADLVTPNKFEAEELLGRKLTSPQDVELGAQEIILTMGPKAVLIKGGHSVLEEQQHQGNESTNTGTAKKNEHDDDVSLGYAQDYLLLSTESSNKGKPVKDRPRLCDGSRGVWIRNARYDTEHTHGTGCTLSSSIATAWAMGQREREHDVVESGSGGDEDEKIGALSSMHLVDACCIAKAYVNAGIAQGMQVCVLFLFLNPVAMLDKKSLVVWLLIIYYVLLISYIMLLK